MIKREQYIKRIRPFMRKDLIKVLTGQRRVGKSMILRLIGEEIRIKDETSNIIFIDKEDYEYDFIKTHKELDEYIKSKMKQGVVNYLLIDEVQEIDGFEMILRSYNKKDNFDIYCTGSNAKMFSGELATFLSGRQIIIHVGSLSFNEFCVFHQLEKNRDTLMKYIRYGGLPYLMHLPDDDDVRFEYLENIFSTILLRDIINRHNVRDSRFLIDLLRFLADNTGSLFSANKISKYLKSQNITKGVSAILNYLSYVEDAYFINEVKRVDIRGKKQFEVGEKYYFEDVGLRNAIVGFRMQDVEKIIENIVFLHLRNSGYKISIGYLENREIDFIAEKNNERIYVQVTYLLSERETIEREFGNLLKIKDNYPKYVVSFDEFSTPNTYKGIKHFTLFDFLTSEVLF